MNIAQDVQSIQMIKKMIDIRLSDNLELMAEMQDNTVDLIYCDILYGTGRKFNDYQDLKPKREVIKEHYIPRIKEMHRILKDTGSIYLQMDTKINHWARCIMDDIFGYNNFRNEIIWNYKNRLCKSKNKYSDFYDILLFYTKSKDYKYIKQYEPYDITYEEFKKKLHQKILLDDLNLEYKKDKRTNKKFYIKNIYDKGIEVHSIFNLDNINPSSKERLNYNTQKPKALIERIIKASSNEGDLVADFYAGSFTTAEVCKDLNRNFIGCDISEKAVEIGMERVRT